MAVINPYANVDWQNDHRILSVSHQHLSHTKSRTQDSFDQIYASGVRHFAISRYRPSILTYPADYANGTVDYVANSFDSTDDLDTIKANDTVSIEFESDCVFSPSAEHLNPYMYRNDAWTKWSGVHVNGLGSLAETGLVPSPNWDHADSEMRYEALIDYILTNLQYADGGGIIFNHLNWTENRNYVHYDVPRLLMDWLDYDARVLGTDVLSGGSQVAYPRQVGVWDDILLTGRRCWGFCQGDWSLDRGRNCLIIPATETKSDTEHECLKAYRNGAFYGRYANSDLDVVSLSFAENVGSGGYTYELTTENADGIDVIVDGMKTTYGGNHVSVTIPDRTVYVRAIAYKGKDEDSDWTYKDGDVYKDLIVLQPIMVNPVVHPYKPAYKEPVDRKKFNTTQRLLFWG